MFFSGTKRPTNPAVGTLMYNQGSGHLLVWTGQQWMTVQNNPSSPTGVNLNNASIILGQSDKRRAAHQAVVEYGHLHGRRTCSWPYLHRHPRNGSEPLLDVMKPSKCRLGYIDTALKEVHHAVEGRSNRDLDLRIENIFNQSEIHSDHLDRSPESASHYTSSLDACRKLMLEACPKGKWSFTTGDDGRHSASVVDDDLNRPINVIGSPMGIPSLEYAILYVLLTKAFIVKRDSK